jgi:hypothetical protein
MIPLFIVHYPRLALALSMVLASFGASAHTGDPESVVQHYNWSKESLAIHEGVDEPITVVGHLSPGAGVAIANETAPRLADKRLCAGCFPLKGRLVLTSNGYIESHYLSPLPLYTYADYWENGQGLVAYLAQVERYGTQPAAHERPLPSHGFERRTVFEQGAMVLQRSENGGQIDFIQLILPDLSLQEGYLFIRRWLGQHITSEQYNASEHTIQFGLSGSLSCSDGGYARVQKVGEEGVLVLTLRSVCD